MTRFLNSANNHRIAYNHIDGASPGVLFLGGFKSDMNGIKAHTLQQFCESENRQFTRFDYLGHGESSGEFGQGTIGRWLQDSLAVLDSVTSGPQILVGSSMGGWLMLLCALSRPKRTTGLLGIASAADFSERLIWASLNEQQRKQLINTGTIQRPSAYQEDPYTISYAFIEEARQHLLLDTTINIDAPVCLIHGQQDVDVPWQISMAIADRLRSEDVSILLLKNAVHRLSTPTQLQVICDQLRHMINKHETGQ